MPNIFDRALFKTPKFSIFDQSESNKLTMPIGRNVPVYYQELYAGDEIDINLAQLTRFMPMLAPVMHRFAVDFIPAFVPFRLLQENGGDWFNAEDFFNPATEDSSRPAIPMVSPLQLYEGIEKILGSVWDYLRYPTFSWLLQRLQQDKYDIYVVDDSTGTQTTTKATYSELFVRAIPSWSGNVDANVIIESSNPQIVATITKLHAWLISKFIAVDGSNHASEWSTEEEFWSVVFKVLGWKQDQAVTEYINYLHLELVKAFVGASTYPQSSTKSLSLLPWLCYRQLMNDWFKNTNIQDVDSDIQHVYNVLDGYLLLSGSFYNYMADAEQIGDLYSGLNSANQAYVGDCDKALWQSDYFTSAFNNPQAAQFSVPIPVNGTIPDLRTASRIQKSLEKTLYAGKRLIDNIFVHRGVRSSDARMHRCEILGHKVFNLKVDDVLQTSQSSIDSSLADFAGYGAVAGGDHLCHYRAEEGGLIMVICRVRPRIEYIEATPKFVLKSDFYDFENPDFDNVGMQPVLLNEIQYQGFGLTRVFGWQRKYADYMYGLDHCHADFKSNMDYWHAARMIDTQPALNEEFISMDPEKDGYNRIFAVPGNERPVAMYIRFDVKVSRPLSRYVHFSF